MLSYKCRVVFGQNPLITGRNEREHCHGEASGSSLFIRLAAFFAQHHKGHVKSLSSTLY